DVSSSRGPPGCEAGLHRTFIRTFIRHFIRHFLFQGSGWSEFISTQTDDGVVQ
ncbi:Pleckstrin homology domain-containing family M member 1, partial [Clarias magur]